MRNMDRTTLNWKFRLLAAAAVVGLAAGWAGQAVAGGVSTDDEGMIRVQTPAVPAEFRNPWPEAYETAYWRRAQPLIAANAGKIRTDTTGEHEKWSIPQTMLAWIAGKGDAAALAALQQGDQNPGDHGHTFGVDLYWSFTLKGQARKYFYFRNLMDKDYVARYRRAAAAWTQGDVKPNMELVLALDSDDPQVVAYALQYLQQMRSKDPKELAKQATNEEARNALLEYAASPLSQGDFGKDVNRWREWWGFFSHRGWKTFEEVERLMNPRPHPKYGIGSGPVGATWNPGVRGFWADARNTDNLRGMREVAAYLFAEEAGNEPVRRLYKEKILRTARGFLGMGMGEWDSEGYHGHSMAAYLNLYDFAQDPEVRSLAKGILDYLSTCAAVKYYRGGWGGPVKRDYGNIKPFSTSASTVYPWFGMAPASQAHSDLELAFVFTSSYRPPMALVKFVEEKNRRGVEMLNSHPNYENWLPGEDQAPAFYETMFYGSTFQLGTLAKGNGGYDTNGFKLLVANDEGTADYIIAATGRNKIGRNNIACSTAGGDRIAQNRSTVLFLNGQNPDADFFFLLPEGASTSEEGGVLFVQCDQSWVAVRPINMAMPSMSKQRMKGNRNAPIFSGKGQGGAPAGFVMEVGDAASHKTFAKFKQAVLGANLDLSRHMAGHVSYTDSLGRQVGMQYRAQGMPIVYRNGQMHDWEQHRAVYRTVGDPGASVDLGWKQYTLEISAGGYHFTGELTPEGRYVSTHSQDGE